MTLWIWTEWKSSNSSVFYFNIWLFQFSESQYSWYIKSHQIIRDIVKYQKESENVWHSELFQAIYDMLGAGSTKPTDTAEERAKNIFNRFSKIFQKIYLSSFDWSSFKRMDENNDGTLTEEEFLKGCLLVTTTKYFSHHHFQSNIKLTLYVSCFKFATTHISENNHSNDNQDDELSKMLCPNVST